MPQAKEYELHMLSFRRKGESAMNVAFGDGGNLQPWHLEILEAWLAEKQQQLAAAKALWDKNIRHIDNAEDLA